MPVLEMIDAALAPLKLKHGVGICVVNPTVDHYVLVPDYERVFEADNDDYVVDEHVNIEFHLGDNYRALIASAKALLYAADIVVLESRYVEYDKETQKHHYTLAVFGRS
ncbi:MAG: hypothetical protein VB061_08350 [Christensenella sp.]|nr:hypothetical protein [Christensenella sp.]